MNFNINSQYDAQKYLLNVSAFTLNNLSRHYDTLYLVDPPLPGHLEPEVTGWVVGQQPLGVGEVDLDLPAQDSVETGDTDMELCSQPVPPEEADHHFVVCPLPQRLPSKVKQSAGRSLQK